LLYVGVSLSALARLSQHGTKPWAAEIVKVTVETLPSRLAAEAAELQAIREETPIYNVAGKPTAERPSRTARPVKARNKLNALQVRNAGPGSLHDGAGLMLLKAARDRGSWVFRFQKDKRRRDMGLGRWPAVSLSDARLARDFWERMLHLGIDPIDAREAGRTAGKA